MKKYQDGVCAICGKFKLAKNQRGVSGLCIDHSHKTGKVRGLLCVGCSIGLGVLEDIEFVSKAKLYLKRYPNT